MTTHVLNCLYDLGHKGQGQTNFILCDIKCKCGYLRWQAQYPDHKYFIVIYTPRANIVSIINILRQIKLKDAKQPYLIYMYI